MRRDFGGDVVQLRGLVAEHDEIGALRDFGVALERLAADLGDERLRALGERIGAEHWLLPASRKRARHVA